ncbi:hypothetical protein CAPTEDRAFT_33844, partial [Capitella teleta]
GEGESEEVQAKKREDWRKLKELEEARKAGTAPAMQDEEGRDINPHIPQYIMQAPWYFGAVKPTLNHQRIQDDTVKEYSRMDEWYKRGVKEGLVATKFKKGSCENCGATTHKKKDCLERPRKVGAKFTGDQIAPDEHIQPNLDFDFDGKRDRWNGYDTTEHKHIVEDFQKLDEAKRMLKSDKLDNELTSEQGLPPPGEHDEDDDDEDEDKYADDMDMPGQKFETKQRITVRNLRIREDTAKYLYNLDVNSAYYDPKTRSMRENPFKNTGVDSSELPYAGDNFVRGSGDAHEMAKKQLFAWEAYEKGSEVHLQADPTKLEVLAREYKNKKQKFKSTVKEGILAKYGGEEHLDAPPKQLLMAQTEDYVEYSRQGAVVKGQEKAKIKSRYEEDVYLNNHSSVWGSYWEEGKWGFKCCHSCIKESYCTGAAGQEAQKAIIYAFLQQYEERLSQARKQKKREKKKKKKEKKRKRKNNESDTSESEDEETAKERRIQEAIKKLDEKEKEIESIMSMDERKRPYNVMYKTEDPTEEELEAYKRKRLRDNDPMMQF